MPDASSAGRNIVLLSDGTGNSSSALFRTNVFRLYEALERSDRQIVHYGDGVGTSSFRLFAILGGIFGFGLKRNVIDLYVFLCRNYRPGDRIFLFGFSRGAFTVRVLAGLIAWQGVLSGLMGEGDLRRYAADAYRALRARPTDFDVTMVLVFLARKVRDGLIGLWRRLRGIRAYEDVPRRTDVPIHFVGVWDTVAAYGGPIEELVRGIDFWIWPLSMPDRYPSIRINRAVHALALDDERHAFWPVLWADDAVPPEDWQPPETASAPIDREWLTQVWFTGMHANVGGGYAEDGLAFVSLRWMIDRAAVYGLSVRPEAQAAFAVQADPLARLANSRAGLGAYYRYRPRDLDSLYAADPRRPALVRDIANASQRDEAVRIAFAPAPKIHDSVFRRIVGGTDGYAPLSIPMDYQVVTEAGDIVSLAYETPEDRYRRASSQDIVRNHVWLRRVAYFLTVFASLFLAAMPLMAPPPGGGHGSAFAFLIPAVDLVAGFLPGLAKPWLDAFRAMPERLAAGLALIALFMLWGLSLEQRIRDGLRIVWSRIRTGEPASVPPQPVLGGFIQWLRTRRLYRGVFYALHQWIVPFLCALALVYAGGAIAARVLLAAGSSLGLVCPAPSAAPATSFDTRARCAPLGVALEAGRSYTLRLRVTQDWSDGGIPASPLGLADGDATRLMALGVPLRRDLGARWMQPVIRIGQGGSRELPLAMMRDADGTFSARFVAPASGPAYLFVNDALLPLPVVTDLFYANNAGSAQVRLEPSQAP